MVVPVLANLNELEPPAKMIDHLLVTLPLPPFDSDIVLASRGNDPEWRVSPRDFADLRVPSPFLVRKVDIALESRGPDREAQVSVQELNEAMQAVVRSQVAAINQRVAAINRFG